MAESQQAEGIYPVGKAMIGIAWLFATACYFPPLDATAAGPGRSCKGRPPPSPAVRSRRRTGRPPRAADRRRRVGSGERTEGDDMGRNGRRPVRRMLPWLVPIVAAGLLAAWERHHAGLPPATTVDVANYYDE